MNHEERSQKTVDRILLAALKLFLEHGYDCTSVQDIANELGDLTKGAVYHHFGSKEEILFAVFNRVSEGTYARLREIRDDATLTGAEKLQATFNASVASPQLDLWARITPTGDVLRNARLLALAYQSIFTPLASCYVQPIIEEGVRDGSIVTAYPRELSEVLVLLANLWVGPLFNQQTPADIARKVSFYLELARGMGVQLEDAGITAVLQEQAQRCIDATGGVLAPTSSPEAGG